MSAALRLAAAPFAALARIVRRRHVRAQIRSCDSELKWIERLRERDEARAAALRSLRAQLRVDLIDLED